MREGVMADRWQPSEFPAARSTGVVMKAGYTYRGLGLYMANSSPKGRRWCLVHLGSGHCIFWIKGFVETAFPIASEVAECSDWTAFDGIDGWKNTDPELKEKVQAIYLRHIGETEYLRAPRAMHERAREVAMMRGS